MGSAGRPSLPYQRSQVTRHRAPRYGRVMCEFPAPRRRTCWGAGSPSKRFRTPD